MRWHMMQMWAQFFEHNCMAAAGALTYTTLFAVVPMMTVTYIIFSLLPEFAEIGEVVEKFIFTNFVPGSSDVVQQKLSEFANQARNLTAVGVGFLFVTAFMLLVTIEKSFNTIWRVPEPRRGMQRFLLYWGVLSLGPVSIVVALLTSLYLMSIPLVSDLDAFGIRETLLSYLPLLVSTAGFTVVYYAVPNCFVPFRHALAGGFVTMVVFQIALKLFAEASKGLSYDAIYGAFAALPVFLIWLYLVWVIILCGAIFVRSLSISRDDDVDGEPVLIKAARILRLLHEAHMHGRAVTDQEIVANVKLNQYEHDRVFAVLTQLKLLGQTENEHWMLGRNLKAITLWDLYQHLPEGLDLQRLKNIDDLPGIVRPLMAITQFGSNEMSVSLDTVFNT